MVMPPTKRMRTRQRTVVVEVDEAFTAGPHRVLDWLVSGVKVNITPSSLPFVLI